MAVVTDSQELQDIQLIFSEIKNTPGKNAKVQIIKENENNEYFKWFLKFLYDEMITTGLDTKKLSKKFEGLHTIRMFDTFEKLGEHVKEFNTGSDRMVRTVNSQLSFYDDELREFLKEVVTKKFKCGITASSVNKALGKGFIPKFEVQLAHPYEKYEHKVVGDFAITQKLDGHRTLAFVDVNNNKVTFRTRKGHEIKGLHEIEENLLKSLRYPGIIDVAVLDGEIVVSDESIAQEDVFSATSKIIRKDGDKTGLEFHVFDFLSLEDFERGQTTYDYKQRRKDMKIMFESYKYEIDWSSDYVKLVPTLYVGADKSVIPELLKKHTDLGHEGLMLNTMDGVYKTKRTPDLLKVKKFNSADILAVDVFEGSGKYKGTLGGIVVDYKGHNVKVGSGFTDSERGFYWDSPEKIIGSVVEVQYFGESKNQKDDNISLRFPTFKSVRSEKTEEDINID